MIYPIRTLQDVATIHRPLMVKSWYFPNCLKKTKEIIPPFNHARTKQEHINDAKIFLHKYTTYPLLQPYSNGRLSRLWVAGGQVITCHLRNDDLGLGAW